MAERGVGNTALGAATCRLIEQYQPEETRLFNDPVVKGLVGAPIELLMRVAGMRNFTMKQTDAMTPGVYGAQICRTRYIDDAVKEAISDGIDQLVILGAGLDTRPYRLPEARGVNVFEVDLASVQDEKKKRLQKTLGRLPENVTYIPIDFDTQTLESVLGKSTYDPTRRAAFLWEGVTQYLTEEAVRQTLSFVGRSASGSVLVFTYVLKSFIERRSGILGEEKMLETVAKNSAPWIFGLEPAAIPAFLQPFHLSLAADVGNADYQESYLKPRGRNLVVTEVERIVKAMVE